MSGRFLLFHRTDDRSEADERPPADLVANVGNLISDMVRASVFDAGEGLRSSAHGVRVRDRTVQPGPFGTASGPAAELTIVRTASLEDAIGCASHLGMDDVDIRPLTEAWDIGLEPKPAELTSRRWMLVEADPVAEAGGPPARLRKVSRRRAEEELRQAGVLLARETLAPTRRGRRYKFSDGKSRVIDGPFAEAKELIGGFVILRAATLDDAAVWVPRYAAVVGCTDLDLRALETEAE